MRGRTAFYGRRHLLQLVAIKKLQAKGQTLAEVQRTLTGQTDGALARLAGIDLDQTWPGPDAAPSSRREFWKEAPASREIEIVANESLAEEGMEAAPRRTSALKRCRAFHSPRMSRCLLASSRPLKSDDLEALRSASAVR